ncbi:MAG: glycosyltransferase [Ruthenibacterium sp.]
MKILIITGTYPMKENPTPSIFTHNQAIALQKAGFDVAVLLFDIRSIRRRRKWGYSQYTYQGVPVYRFAIPCGPFAHIGSVLSQWAVRACYPKVIRNFGKPDILHAHFSDAAVCASSFKRKYNMPLVMTEHSSGILSQPKGSFAIKQAQRAYETADVILAVGSVLQKRVEELSQKKVHLVPNILPITMCYQMQEKPQAFTFISVGSLQQGKRFDLTLQAFAQFRRKHPKAKLLIVGKGSQKGELLQLVHKLKAEGFVRFLGSVPNEEMPQIYAKAHVFVLPSDMETFGVVYAEAIACGLPAIATDCGGPTDIITPQNGIVIPKDDEETLLQAMELVFVNYKNYDRQQNAKDILKKFGEKSIVKQLTEVYNAVYPS